VGEGRKDGDEAFPLQHGALQKSTFTSRFLHTIFICVLLYLLAARDLHPSYDYTFLDWRSLHDCADRICFNFKMGVMQRALSQTIGGVSPLRTSFVGALIALCLIWSILSLDMSRIRSTVVCPLAVVEKR
jgi:hypothetical protein